MMKRNVVKIDQEKCNGCGLCVGACAEGAIQMVDGKAKLVSDVYCDGLGACLGECPQDAITIEEREAEAFDEKAVEKRLSERQSEPPRHSGCPGMMAKTLTPRTDAVEASENAASSQLSQWPIQLALVSPHAPYWNGADLLISADCVAHANAGFHQALLKGKKLIIACPKLDETEPYVEKLKELFNASDVKSLTIARMEVPCCQGIVAITKKALELSGKDIPTRIVTIGINGDIQ